VAGARRWSKSWKVLPVNVELAPLSRRTLGARYEWQQPPIVAHEVVNAADSSHAPGSASFARNCQSLPRRFEERPFARMLATFFRVVPWYQTLQDTT
jgi:hypothetical protein